MITCDTKQIALGIGQCSSWKARVRGGSLGEGGSAENFWFLVLPQEGMIDVGNGWLQLLFTATNFFGGKFDSAIQKNYTSKWLDIEEKLIVIFSTSILYLKFKVNNKNEMAAPAFLGFFLFHLMTEQNQPNSQKVLLLQPLSLSFLLYPN